MTSGGAHPGRGFALRLALLAAGAGLAVAVAAGHAAGGQCGAVEVGEVRRAADPVCAHLVRTLSTRMGVVAAVATVVIVLTMAGLARLAAARPASWEEGPPRR